MNIIDEQVLEQCNINIKNDGLSFVDFTKVLSTLDLTVRPDRLVDIHLRKQHHPIWDAKFGKKVTINLDEVNLNAELNAFAKEYDLGQTAFDEHPQFERIEKIHYARDVSIEMDDQSVEDIRLPRRNPKKWFPKTALLQSRFVQQSAQKLYATDYQYVASGTETQKRISTLRRIYHRLAHR